MADEKNGLASIRESFRKAWEEISRPYPTDEELEHMEDERRILWRKVEQLEAENRFLREEVRWFSRRIVKIRNELRQQMTDLDRELISYNDRMQDHALQNWSSRDKSE